MNKLTSVAEGVTRFFEAKREQCPEYEIVKGTRYDTIKWNGKTAPLMGFKEHPKLIGITYRRDLMGDPLALTAYSVDNTTLDVLLFREMIIAEMCFKSEVVKVTVFVSGPSANALMKLANDGTYHVCLHAAQFGEKHFKHEFFNSGGMIANRAVDTMVEQHALNIYTADGYEQMTDNHYILYGLSEDEVNEVVAIYATMMKDDTDKLSEQVKRIDKIVDVALANAGKCVVKGEDF